MIVLDTHVFIWFAWDDPRLESWIKRVLEDDPSQVYVPTICLWEALLLVEKGRISVEGQNPGRTLRQYIDQAGFVEAALTADIAVLSRTLPFAHNDPADRFIAATAHSLGAALATKDIHLRNLPWLKLLT